MDNLEKFGQIEEFIENANKDINSLNSIENDELRIKTKEEKIPEIINDALKEIKSLLQ